MRVSLHVFVCACVSSGQCVSVWVPEEAALCVSICACVRGCMRVFGQARIGVSVCMRMFGPSLDQVWIKVKPILD